jgi:methyl-accepting chemotaxis protein
VFKTSVFLKLFFTIISVVFVVILLSTLVQSKMMIRFLLNEHVIGVSRSSEVINAMQALSKTWSLVEGDLDLCDDEKAHVRSRLFDFYQSKFLPEFADDTTNISAFNTYKPQSANGVLLQDLYLASNDYSAGQRGELIMADDASDYTVVHGDYQLGFKRLMNEFGYDDIYLIDAQSGVIVYSVTKEVDFSTSLLDGPYSDSGLAAVYKQVKESNKRDVVLLSEFSIYRPLHDAEFVFIASPIFDTDVFVGVFVIRLSVKRALPLAFSQFFTRVKNSIN